MKLFRILPFLIALVAVATPAHAACTNCTITSVTMTTGMTGGGAYAFSIVTNPAASPALDHVQFFLDGTLAVTANATQGFAGIGPGTIGPGKHTVSATATFGNMCCSTVTDVPSSVQNQVVTDDIVGAYCAVSAGGAYTWGPDDYGQIGNGSTGDFGVSAPYSVGTVGGTVKSVSCDGEHTCALRSDGAIRCWGDNSFGQLGDNTITARPTPVTVSGVTTATQVSTGSWTTCATIGGAAKCWGNNGYGQLGDGTTTFRHVPTQVSGLTSGVVMVSIGDTAACALLTSGAVKCWGDNSAGIMGNGTTSFTPQLTPIATNITSGATYVSVGRDFACAVVSGVAQCWGSNAGGNLGTNDYTSRFVPTTVTNLASTPMRSIIASRYFNACAVSNAGAGYCWGYDQEGELGNGQSGSGLLYNSSQAVGAPFSSGTAELFPGGGDTIGSNGGHPYSFGSNNYGQLGQGTTDTNAHSTPARVSGL